MNSGETIDYRYEDRKQVGELRGEVGAISEVLTTLSKNPHYHPPKYYN
jgi:hypothetical protein